MLVRLIGKNLLQRPLRYALTGFAIVFSVAAVCAVFIFTDGLRRTFDELATNTEFALDVDSFAAGDYEVGERYTVQVRASVERGRTFTLVGTFTFANPDKNVLVGCPKSS